MGDGLGEIGQVLGLPPALWGNLIDDGYEKLSIGVSFV